MLTNRRRGRQDLRRREALALCCAAMLVTALLLTWGAFRANAQDKRLSIYSPQSSYSVATLDSGGAEYVGLVDILEPLGKVDARADGKKWKMTFTPNGGSKQVELQFTDRKNDGKVRGNGYKLSGQFLLLNSRGYVPVSSLGTLLPRILDVTLQMHEGARRVFLGASPFKYTAELKKDPSRLVLTFPSAVSPSIATEPGQMRMVFAKDAVVSAGNDNASFGDPLISGLQFREANGAAEIAIQTSAPVVANFSDGGKTITISAAPQQASAPAVPKTETPLPPPSESAKQAPARPAALRFLVIIDAAHGGDERGAQLTTSLAEKDVVLGFARRLHREIEARGISATLVRQGDNSLTLDQRAQSANASHAAIFITVHASSTGNGVRLFTALMPPTATPPTRKQFLPWETAQAPFLDLSKQVAGSVAAECNTRQIAVRALSAALRPLNNLAVPAFGVEIAPPGSTVEEVNDAKYQQGVATAIASGIVAVRARLEAQQK